jgi:hypothetical protein
MVFRGYPDIWGSPFGDLYNWGFIIWGLGKNSFGDWKIHIWGFVQLGIWKKILLGILKNNRHLGIEKYIWGYTFGDAKKYNWGFKKFKKIQLGILKKTCTVVLLRRRLIE